MHQVTKCMATDSLACDEHYPLIRYTGQLITSECNFLLPLPLSHDGAVKFGLKTRVNFELMAKIASDPDSTVTTAVLVPD